MINRRQKIICSCFTASSLCSCVCFVCVFACVQTLFMLGALLIAMSMQLDRKGLWNLLGPVLFAILLMVASWVSPLPHYSVYL